MLTTDNLITLSGTELRTIVKVSNAELAEAICWVLHQQHGKPIDDADDLHIGRDWKLYCGTKLIDQKTKVAALAAAYNVLKHGEVRVCRPFRRASDDEVFEILEENSKDDEGSFAVTLRRIIIERDAALRQASGLEGHGAVKPLGGTETVIHNGFPIHLRMSKLSGAYDSWRADWCFTSCYGPTRRAVLVMAQESIDSQPRPIPA